MERAALLSVSDKQGLRDFALLLVRCGFRLLATSGTKAFLDREGVRCESVESYTGQAEILDGRVKTLHPKIHAGLLAKRGDPAHEGQLADLGILPIDVAVVNLYPFGEVLAADPGAGPAKMTEYVDVGGPTMIRAAAKNHVSVLPLVDPADYAVVGPYLQSGRPVPPSVRTGLAAKVFAFTAAYDLAVARYYSTASRPADGDEAGAPGDDAAPSPVFDGVVASLAQDLRYGENPHQSAAYYRTAFSGPPDWRQRGGKDLSYNNMLDADAMVRMLKSLAGTGPAAVIVKHLNPCGASVAADLLTALRNAKRGDPRSHFGGVVGFNDEVTEEVALAVREDFAEIVVAPSYSKEALVTLRKNKALRLVEADLAPRDRPRDRPGARREVRSALGGFLVQDEDAAPSGLERATSRTSRAPTPSEAADLALAWTLVGHVKSNAVVLVKGGTLVGSGAGQTSRIDSVELALSKAARHGHDVRSSVAASDAFFPFPDSVETLAAAGVSAVVSPGGAKRDEDVIAAAESAGLSLLFVPDRHFRH